MCSGGHAPVCATELWCAVVATCLFAPCTGVHTLQNCAAELWCAVVVTRSFALPLQSLSVTATVQWLARARFSPPPPSWSRALTVARSHSPIEVTKKIQTFSGKPETIRQHGEFLIFFYFITLRIFDWSPKISNTHNIILTTLTWSFNFCRSLIAAHSAGLDWSTRCRYHEDFRVPVCRCICAVFAYVPSPIAN